ncbi:MAG: M20 metallopeptidase family protein [Adhaeribacter sp.]
MLKEKIQALAHAIHGDVQALRRHLHAHPELSFQEYNTSAFIKARLDELGIAWQAMADTGVVATITGALPSERVIALRADIDALPITEANEVDYKSTCEGVMHACGHDAHTASLLGTARILTQLQGEFGGTVKLIFQPAEERIPGGAAQMIREGVLENPRPQAVLGQHVMPSLPAGKVAIKPGKFMASTDELYVVVKGKGGHAAQPQDNIDPVLIASSILVALQQLVSRTADPRMPTVLSFGKMIAQGATNIIPNEVYLEGTFRTLDEQWRQQAHHKMQQLATGIAESMGGSCEFKIVRGYPFLLNEENLAAEVKQLAGEYLGPANVVEWDIWMAGEDFAYYSQVTDACFYLLGVGNTSRGIGSSLHTPTFQVEEEALALSTGLMAYMALRKLGA